MDGEFTLVCNYPLYDDWKWSSFFYCFRFRLLLKKHLIRQSSTVLLIFPRSPLHLTFFICTLQSVWYAFSFYNRFYVIFIHINFINTMYESICIYTCIYIYIYYIHIYIICNVLPTDRESWHDWLKIAQYPLPSISVYFTDINFSLFTPFSISLWNHSLFSFPCFSPHPIPLKTLPIPVTNFVTIISINSSEYCNIVDPYV